jgi:tripartite-type tricarboxylate transporter receptor subunit TctC
MWGQPVVVENKPGGGGTIGTLAGSRAAPDGYTLLMTALGQLVIFPSMQATPPYHAVTDFEPVVPLVRTPWVLFINGKLPVNSVQEFIAYAKAKPGELNGATPGLGTTNHLANAMLMKVAGIKAENVHYNGSAQAIQDLMAGREQFMFDSLLSLRFLGDGRLKAIAVSGPTRSPHAPDLPTMIESGVPDFDVTVWFGIFMPPKTPADIVAKVNADIQKAMASKDVQDRLAVAKFEYIFKMTPSEFKDMLKRDSDKWSKVVRDIGIKAE